eukprot:3077978-Amphidinium_carterae.1
MVFKSLAHFLGARQLDPSIPHLAFWELNPGLHPEQESYHLTTPDRDHVTSMKFFDKKFKNPDSVMFDTLLNLTHKQVE